MKSKKNLARKILCGLLAAGVVGVAGSAMAAEYTYVSQGRTDYTLEDTEIIVNRKNSCWPAIQFIGDKNKTLNVIAEKIILNSMPLKVKADNNESGGLEVEGGKAYIGTENTKEISINVNDSVSSNRTYGIGAFKGNNYSAHIIVTTEKLNIALEGTKNTSVVGLWAQNNNDSSIPLDDTDTTEIIINANKTVIDVKNNNTNGSAVGIAAYSGSRVVINSDLEVNADKVISTRGNAITKINEDGTHTVKLNGNIDFNITNDGNSGKKSDAKVILNLSDAASYFNGSVNKSLTGDETGVDMSVTGMTTNISNGAAWNMTGDSFVNNATVANGGAINVGNNVENFDADKITMNDGNLNLKGDNQNVKITNVDGTGGTISTDSLDNKINITTSKDADTKLTVLGSGDIADAIKSGSSNAQQLANVVTSGSEGNEKSVASEVRTEEGKVAGAFYAKVDANGDIDANTVVSAENTTNRAISDMASLSLMTWRQENNDMNKRLGELRDSKGEHGAWARMARGESKYGAQNVKNQYNYYQVGYDEKLSVNPNWTVGVALTRTEGTSTFTNGSGENKHTGFAVYGSYLNDNGSFIDLIAKYARMDNEYTTSIGAGSGDYETNGYSLSAEYGKRFTKDNGLWIEPQVELTYGRVGSADYVTANGVQARQNGMDSLVGRLGFSLGQNIKQGNVYVRASYLYDFDGETDVRMLDTQSGAADSYKQDLGGGWWEVGVGTNLNLSEATHLYFDVEKTYGGNVATPWQWNAGVRWSF